jgi:hypothetical protein
VTRQTNYTKWKTMVVFNLHRLRTSKPLSLLEKMISALTG